MKQELPNLVDERRFRRREPEQVERDEFGRVSLPSRVSDHRVLLILEQRKWPEERIPIDLEPLPGFNLRAQVVGHGGAYVKHIQQETRCRVQIKGRGSGFMEHGTGQESDEAMYLHVAWVHCILAASAVLQLTDLSGPDPREVQHAKELCEDLLVNVKEQYQRFKENPPQQNRGYGSGSYQQNDRQGHGGYSGGYGGGYGGQQSPAPASAMSPTIQAPPGTPGAPGAGSPTDYSAQYAQYYGGQDPYAAYGGYQVIMPPIKALFAILTLHQNYVAYYQYYQQQAAQQQQAAPGAPPGPPSDPPPPPPPSGSPPAANGAYNAVSIRDRKDIPCDCFRLILNE